MKMQSLNDLLIHQLQDLYGAEQQLLKAMPKMASTAKSAKLKQALETHMTETQNQVKRLEQVFQSMGIEAEAIKCKAMEGLLKEADEMLSEDADPEVMDAGIIASAQRVEHYEIAGYGTASTYAKYLGHNEAFTLLQETLNEEKKTDELLTGIAESSVNIKAENH
ncbi:YciE/YciF ferroxidase family protein [Adhaeribacter radiodurans]|uniref:Ferritin-like domain-containing protein n=1 Tax=Adhaeribacter radiodurans TaxID=2745197 RepID=A0A7L7L7V8_9BACT|nr:ferritin-like domain-containing protein [Adhaeribacter radiodurans]QMU28459.1 ferritin-like domain-containing protein [Adhaeribacter radiodurans]